MFGRLFTDSRFLVFYSAFVTIAFAASAYTGLVGAETRQACSSSMMKAPRMAERAWDNVPQPEAVPYLVSVAQLGRHE